MLKLRGCPKCQGTLQLSADMYGKYVNCLQCGFTRDLPESDIRPEPAKGIRPAFAPPERKAA